MHSLINNDALEVLPGLGQFSCIFADPVDNINLGYDGYKDNLPTSDYLNWLDRCVKAFTAHTNILWLSFNARWTIHLGAIARDFTASNKDWDVKPCVQTFTFFQQNQYDLGNAHRPLWRFMKKGTPIYPDAIRIPSWRLENGDPRANPDGCVPGDVFDFTRVTGNSGQRRPWHKTQLNEGLVERCIKLSTKEGDMVLDPFGGTGTTLRVCKGIKRQAYLIEISRRYCSLIAQEHGMEQYSPTEWKLEEKKAWWENGNGGGS